MSVDLNDKVKMYAEKETNKKVVNIPAKEAHPTTVNKEIKKHGIYYFSMLGDWVHIDKKDIKFFDNGKQFKALGRTWKIKDINKTFIIMED